MSIGYLKCYSSGLFSVKKELFAIDESHLVCSYSSPSSCPSTFWCVVFLFFLFSFFFLFYLLLFFFLLLSFSLLPSPLLGGGSVGAAATCSCSAPVVSCCFQDVFHRACQLCSLIVTIDYSRSCIDVKHFHHANTSSMIILFFATVIRLPLIPPSHACCQKIETNTATPKVKK